MLRAMTWVAAAVSMTLADMIPGSNNNDNNNDECISRARSVQNMHSCAEHVQIQKYTTRVYKTLKTACVQTVMLKHPTEQ